MKHVFLKTNVETRKYLQCVHSRTCITPTRMTLSNDFTDSLPGMPCLHAASKFNLPTREVTSNQTAAGRCAFE